MKYKAVIFDLDGVICHTDKYHYEAWKVIADRLQIPFDEEINNRLRGVSRMESLHIILEKYNEPMSEQEKMACAEEKNNIYKKLLEQMSPADLSIEVKETLEELRYRGIKLAIGSSSKNARFILKQIGLDNFFDGISDGNNIVKSKPDPEVFLKAAKFINMGARDCLVVEDAVAGIEAASTGKMDSCAIGEVASCPAADYKLKSFQDILIIVDY